QRAMKIGFFQVRERSRPEPGFKRQKHRPVRPQKAAGLYLHQVIGPRPPQATSPSAAKGNRQGLRGQGIDFNESVNQKIENSCDPAGVVSPSRCPTKANGGRVFSCQEKAASAGATLPRCTVVAHRCASFLIFTN